MGQYYNIIIQEKGHAKVHVYDRTIDGEYTMAKLMEHSWFLNPMCNAVAEKLYYTPSKIAWVGDYADEEGDDLTLYNYAYPKDHKFEPLYTTSFTLCGKLLINHDKKLILDCWLYMRLCIQQSDCPDWIVHPLPLLTAIGNGRGGGDYHGINKDMVGSWAWDTLEIVEYKEKEIKELQEAGYSFCNIIFKE